MHGDWSKESLTGESGGGARPHHIAVADLLLGEGGGGEKRHHGGQDQCSTM